MEARRPDRHRSQGTITAVRADAKPEGALHVAGPLIPGMPNLHSHAFQRAIAGRTGNRGADGDSFWTWRQAMYAFLDRVDADAFEAIAAQAYVEMLKAGYTSVAEFHYVHHDPQGRPTPTPPSSRGASSPPPPRPASRSRCCRCSMRTRDSAACRRRRPASLRAHGRCLRAARRDACAASRGGAAWNLGVAPHSLRAVTPDELTAIVALVPRGAPIHIHAAEQLKEVAECVAWSGARPVEWLLDHAGARRALVRRARDAHDGRGDAPARRERRGRGARADDRGGPRRRHVRGARLSRRGRRVRRRQRLEHDHRSVRRTAPARMVAAPRAQCAQRARDAATRRSGRRSTSRRRGGGAQATGATLPARSRPDAAPISSCSTPTIPRSRSRASTRCSTPRSSVRAGTRCAT